jgi:hypothetical protein
VWHDDIIGCFGLGQKITEAAAQNCGAALNQQLLKKGCFWNRPEKPPRDIHP